MSSADRICHVMPMSLEAYKRAGIYKDDKETINSIKGARNEDAGISNEILDRKEAREGLTYSRDLDQIIVWEVYTRDKDGKWEMECFSPEAPQIRLRDKMEVPYAHGEPPSPLLHTRSQMVAGIAQGECAKCLPRLRLPFASYGMSE